MSTPTVNPIVTEIRTLSHLPVLLRAAKVLALQQAHAREVLETAALEAMGIYWCTFRLKGSPKPVFTIAPEEAAEAVRGETLSDPELKALDRQSVLLIICAMFRKHMIAEHAFATCDCPTGTVCHTRASRNSPHWIAFVDRVHKAFDPLGLTYRLGTEFFRYTHDLPSIRISTSINLLFESARHLAREKVRASLTWNGILANDPEALLTHLMLMEEALDSATTVAGRSDEDLVNAIYEQALCNEDCEAVALSKCDAARIAALYERAAAMVEEEED